LTQTGLADALARHLGDQISVADSAVTDASGLMDAEHAAVVKAVDKRRFEFAAGRRAARSALSAFGMAEVAIPAGADRAPIWPPGILGSITHDDGIAMALVGRTKTIAAIGIDLTKAEPLPGKTRSTILRAEEKDLNELEARAVFSVKECLFKTLHPDVQTFFGFDAAIVRPNIAQGSFTATLTCDLDPYAAGSEFRGTLLHQDQRFVAALVLPCKAL
jgi:4'-phosphopantetheinyl transferase EntD